MGGKRVFWSSVAFVIAAWAASNASAGVVLSANFFGQPLVYQKAGKINACGVRFVGLSNFSNPQEVVRIIDSSFTVTSQAVTMVKAGMKKATGADIAARSPRTEVVYTKSFWMRAAGGNPTAPLDGKFHQSPEDAGFLLYVASSEPVTELIGVLNGVNELQIGMRPSNEGSDWVLAGKVQMNEADRLRVSECLDTLLRNMDEGSPSR